MSSGKEGNARKNEQVLMELLKQDANKYCADCGQKGTRWASWNLGVFLCIRCGGLHRKLGTHISKVKSVNLDKWTDEQLESIVAKGNAKMNAIYNPHPGRFSFPAYSGDMESYIRDKYERKLFMSADAQDSFPPVNKPTAQYASGPRGGNLDTTRYPLQMKALQGMGFNDINANASALATTHGNLQEALDVLLASKANSLSMGGGATESRSSVPTTQRQSDPSADLVDVFSVPSPPPPPHHHHQHHQQEKDRPDLGSADNRNGNVPSSRSILDMDTEELQSTSALSEGEATDEFEEFESAPAGPFQYSQANSLASNNVAPANKKALETKPHGSNMSPPLYMPPLKAAPGTSSLSDLSNPWANNNTVDDGHGHMGLATSGGAKPSGSNSGDAFDDIDPFRGYNPNRS